MRLMEWSAMRVSTVRIRFGVDAIRFRRADQGINRSGPLTT